MPGLPWNRRLDGQRLHIAALFITFLLSGLNLFSQALFIKGTVTDAGTGEPVIGAAVVIRGTTNGAATSLDGEYRLKLSSPGNYTLVVSFLSYKTQEISVNLTQDTLLDVRLLENARDLGAVEVTARKRNNTEMSAIADMKMAEMVVNSVSAQTISKNPDRDAAQVMRRIPGITVTDERFVVVRGLGTRYNTVLFNGLIAPSVEAESRAFSFDLIPAGFLDRVNVYKSGSPEIPGEFAGAVISLFTRNEVAENFVSFNYTTGYRAGTTFKPFAADPSGNKDYLGLGKFTRSLPEGFPTNLREHTFDFQRLATEGKKFENNFYTRSITASPDQRLRFDLGRNLKIGGRSLTTLNSVSYSNTFLRQDIQRSRFINYGADGTAETEYQYNDDKSENNVRIGLISNWSAETGKNSRIDFRNLFTHMGSTEVVERTGIRGAKNANEERNLSWRYMSRNIYTGQVSGLHMLGSDKMRLTWTGGLSVVKRDEPDWRRSQERRPVGAESDFSVHVPYNATPQSAARFNSALSELTAAGTAELSRKFGSDGQHIFRTGFYVENKSRSYAARTIGYVATSRTSPEILRLPGHEIFSPENVDQDSGLLIAEATKHTDSYDAHSLLTAAYVGSAFEAGSFSFSGGLRLEASNQDLKTAPAPSGLPETAINHTVNLLPFVNAAYNISGKKKIRLSYGMTVNRPEFREMAPFSFYNFDLNADVVGNKALRSSKINNADLRYEYYPEGNGLFTVGVFYKSFTDPIEFIITTGADNPVYIYSNAASSRSAGLELEGRHNLSFISPALSTTGIVVNASLIRSRIIFDQQHLTQASERPMQGQSPYVVNAGMYYQDEKGYAASLLYNVYGKRIFLVGDAEYPTSWEMPRHIIDLSISRRFAGNCEVRLTVNDLLNAPYHVTEDGNNDLKISSGADRGIISTTSGAYYTLGLTYRF